MQDPHPSELSFVKHHPKWCCLTPENPSACRELGSTEEIGACRFLARVVFEGVSLDGVMIKADDLAWKCSALLMRVANKRVKYGGSVTASEGLADCIARAAFGGYATYRNIDRLISLFASQAEAESACRRVMADALDRSEEEITPTFEG